MKNEPNPTFTPPASAICKKDNGNQEITIPIEQLGEVITKLMAPVVTAFGKALENNTAALEQMAAAQAIQNDRIAGLEKQIRLQTPVSAQQVRYLNEATKKRAREMLDKRGIDNDKATTKLAGFIRKDVLARYGVGHLREIPKHEYSVAMNQIGTWSNLLTVMDIVRVVKFLDEPTETYNPPD